MLILGSLRISTVNFSFIPNSCVRGGHVPNGYAGFNWENACYITRYHAIPDMHWKGFRKAFHDAQENVVYNDRGAALTISLPNPGQRFGLHSFEAISVYHNELRLFITAYRSNVIFNTKYFILTKDQLELFEVDWEEIDRVVIKPQGYFAGSKPITFALSSLNLVFS